MVNEFKISYSKLGPTELRAFAVLLNTAMYLGGAQVSSWTFGMIDPITFTPYDLIIALIALLLLSFFIVTAVRETIRLAKENK